MRKPHKSDSIFIRGDFLGMFVSIQFPNTDAAKLCVFEGQIVMNVNFSSKDSGSPANDNSGQFLVAAGAS